MSRRKGRVVGSRAALRYLTRVAIANNAIEEREDRRGNKKWSFAEEVRFVSELLTQQANHEIVRVLEPRISQKACCAKGRCSLVPA